MTMENFKDLSPPGSKGHDDIAAGDRRTNDRQISILRLVKITSDLAEGWGMIKNISSAGVMIEIHPDFALADRINILFTEAYELAANIRWRKAGSIGAEFDQPVNIEELLAKTVKPQNGQKSRVPRVRISSPVALKKGIMTIRAEIYDISPGGLRVKTDYNFAAGNKVVLSIPELEEISGTIRWAEDGQAGIAFQDRMPITLLMAWLANIHKAARDDDSGE